MTAEALVRVLVFHALPLTTSAIAVRRSALEDVGGFDPGLPRHQDRDLLLRLAVHHSVAIATGADVIKYQSPDSFSRDATTYMSGLDALVARHPAFLDPAAHDVLAYLIARVMIREFATGRIGPALQAARALRSAKHLPMGPLSALSHYWRGRRMRRKAEAELAKASPHDPEGVKATAPGPHHRQ